MCRPYFTSHKCDRCTLGFRNFPECTACNCNANGTHEEFCDVELGVCGCEDDGQCVCKVVLQHPLVLVLLPLCSVKEMYLRDSNGLANVILLVI